MVDIPLDARTAFLILVFAAVFTAGQAVWGLARVGVNRRKVNKRLATAEKTGSLEQLVLRRKAPRSSVLDVSKELMRRISMPDMSMYC